MSQPFWREVFLESSLQDLGPLVQASQAETLVTGQLPHETIYRFQQEAVYQVVSANFTFVYHLREKFRRSSEPRKH